jgi:uncharacterized membrane protein YobD (UPF0266 family)
MLHTTLDIVMLMHGFLTMFALMTAAGFVGLLLFSNEQRRGAINTLKMLALLTAIFVFALIFLVPMVMYFIDYLTPIVQGQ